MALALVFGLAAALVAGMVYAPVRRKYRRRALANQAFPEQWQCWLNRSWLLYRRLPPSVRRNLQRQLQVMMPNTRFYGCGGLEVTEKMRVLTLAQAALLYENRSQDFLADFPTVLLYPDPFVRDDELSDESGLVSRERRVLQGESWEQGRVILSWQDIQRDLRHADGHNLVIHEFVHQVDGYDGAMDGMPLLPDKAHQQRWLQVMGAAYRALCQDAEQGWVDIDPYATVNEAEFLAVTSEYFFTAPFTLQTRFPGVYAEFVDFYRQDPLSWYLRPPEGPVSGA